MVQCADDTPCTETKAQPEVALHHSCRRCIYHASQDEALDDKDALYAVFEDLIKGIDFSFKQGDVVSGTVFEIDQKGAYLDIGAKSAAFCPTAEVSLCKIGRVGCILIALLTADVARRKCQLPLCQ